MPVKHYNDKIREKFKDEDFIANDLGELDMRGYNNIDHDLNFIDKFNKRISNKSIQDSESTHDSLT